MKAHPYIQNKRDKYTLSNPKNNYCKGAHSQHKHKEKNNWKIFLPTKKNSFTNIPEGLCPLQERLF